MSRNQYPSVDFIRQSLRYENGRVFWLERPKEHFVGHREWITWNKRFSGKEAGGLVPIKPEKPRWTVRFDGMHVYRYCIVWALRHGEWPSQIDHKNRCCIDDRIENLRLATVTQNLANMAVHSDNASGYKGVTLHGQHGGYYARIQVNGQRVYLGYFKDAAQAHIAYMEAARKYFGEFACNGVS